MPPYGADELSFPSHDRGEFAFIPVAVDKKYEVYATRVDSLIEYGVFGNDNSSAPYGGT